MAVPGGASTLKVLVVDNDQAILCLTCQILERAGYDVIRADGGLKAVDLFEAQQPDIVLTDFMMLDLNGAALARLSWARTVGNPSRTGAMFQ